MIKAASVALALDLREFSQYLRSRGIGHRINEESGEQVIWVEDDLQAEFVRQLLQEWDFSQPGALPLTTASVLPSRGAFSRGIVRAFRESPVSLCLIGVCLLVAAISALGARADRVASLFYPLLASDSLFAALADIDSLSQLVRTFTPMFLHFGELHLIFNMLWLWYFGRQLEPVQPVWLYTGVVLITAFASNTTQYLYTHYNNFGGMSGVVYGLVGYTWIVHIGMPRSRLELNNSTFVVFVIALVVMELVASSWIATAAHLGGLVSGLILGVLTVVYYRVLRQQDSIHK